MNFNIERQWGLSILSSLSLFLVSACSGGNSDEYGPECTGNSSCPPAATPEPIHQGERCEGGGYISTDPNEILGTWKNEERYLIAPGDPVERMITFNAENFFQSLSIVYNGCPYEENPAPESGCDGWYSQEISEMGYFTYADSKVTLYFSEKEEVLLVKGVSQDEINFSVGDSCAVVFKRM